MTSDDAVRRLLAALDEHDRRDPPGLPADVAARLDARLASLAGERDRAPQDAVVVPLRRRVRPALAAAAAVVLVAGGGALLAGDLLTGDARDEASSAAGGSAAQSTSDEEDASDRPEAAAERGDSLRTLRAAPELQRGDLAEQVRLLVAEGTLRLDPGAAARRGQSARVRVAGCVSPDVAGARLGVRYDAQPATLVVGVADGGARDVRVVACSGDQVLDRTQVPADLAPR